MGRLAHVLVQHCWISSNAALAASMIHPGMTTGYWCACPSAAEGSCCQNKVVFFMMRKNSSSLTSPSPSLSASSIISCRQPLLKVESQGF